MGRESKAPSVHGKHAKRIENIKHMPRAHNKDQYHLAHIKCTQQRLKTRHMQIAHIKN